MRHSTAVLSLSLGTVCLAVGACLAPPRTVQQAGAAVGWEMPRTPEGRPDLQGNYTNATLTRIERPEEFENLVLSVEQVAEIEGRRVEEIERANQPSDPDRAPPPQGGFERGQGGPFGSGGTGTYNEFWTDKGDRVAVFDGEHRSSLITDPPDGRIPPLTPEARQRQEERQEFMSQFGEYDNPENRPLAERCIKSFGSNLGPPMLPNYAYNNNYTIVQTPDHVLILTEMVHDFRIIEITDDPNPPPDHVRPWFGYSWGHWQGDTLVVETTNLHPDQARPGGARPSSEFRAVERLYLAGPATLNYEFTVEDPATYTRPWSGQVPFNRTPDGVFEYACHEANYSLEGVLSGARAQEEAQKADEREEEEESEREGAADPDPDSP